MTCSPKNRLKSRRREQIKKKVRKTTSHGKLGLKTKRSIRNRSPAMPYTVPWSEAHDGRREKIWGKMEKSLS